MPSWPGLFLFFNQYSAFLVSALSIEILLFIMISGTPYIVLGWSTLYRSFRYVVHVSLSIWLPGIHSVISFSNSSKKHLFLEIVLVVISLMYSCFFFSHCDFTSSQNYDVLFFVTSRFLHFLVPNASVVVLLMIVFNFRQIVLSSSPSSAGFSSIFFS